VDPLMNLRLVRSLLCSSLLLGPSGAHAARVIVIDDAPCPFEEGDKARIYEKVADNRLGGQDADGATYAKGGQWRNFKVATCERSLYSFFAEDVRMVLSASQRRAVALAIAPLKTKLAKDGDPNIWERHELAIAGYAALGRTDLFQADALLEAAWTARDLAVGETTPLEGPSYTRELLDAGRLELAKDLSPSQRKNILFNLARIAHRGGYVKERDAYYAEWASLGPLSAEESKVKAQIDEATAAENRLMAQALEKYRKALQSPSITAEDRAHARYLEAELSRRLGETKAALPLFHKAIVETGLSPELRAWAAVLAAELDGRRLDPPASPQ
jgi:hypothetical protein